MSKVAELEQRIATAEAREREALDKLDVLQGKILRAMRGGAEDRAAELQGESEALEREAKRLRALADDLKCDLPKARREDALPEVRALEVEALAKKESAEAHLKRFMELLAEIEKEAEGAFGGAVAFEYAYQRAMRAGHEHGISLPSVYLKLPADVVERLGALRNIVGSKAADHGSRQVMRQDIGRQRPVVAPGYARAM